MVSIDLLDGSILERIRRLEEQIPLEVQKLYSDFRMKSGTKAMFLEGLLQLLTWYRDNYNFLSLMNRNTWGISVCSSIVQFIKEYFVFLNSLHYKDLSEIDTTSKQWEWFKLHIKSIYGIDLFVDAAKVLQAKELDKIIQREKKSVKRPHISLDVTDPEALSYSVRKGG